MTSNVTSNVNTNVNTNVTTHLTANGKKIFLLRHDQVTVPDNHPSGLAGRPLAELGGVILGQLDYPITATRDQPRYNAVARAIANSTANNKAADDIFFAGSDLIRVRQTFDHVVATMKNEGVQGAWQLATDKNFREQHFGAWHGMTYTMVEATDKQAYDFFWQDFITRAPPPDQAGFSESFTDLCQRVVPALENLLTTRREKIIVLVAHDGVLRALLAYIYQTLPSEKPTAMEEAMGRAMAHKLPYLSLLKIDYEILTNPVIDFL